MKQLRLTHLRIVLDCTVLQDVPHNLSPGDLANAKREPDLQLIAARFMDTMSVLDCLFLEARDRTYVVSYGLDWMEDEGQTVRKWRSSSAWQVIRDVCDEALFPSGANSPRSWTELSGEAAERIADQEELDVFRAEEVCGLLRPRESSVLIWSTGPGTTVEGLCRVSSSSIPQGTTILAGGHQATVRGSPGYETCSDLSQLSDKDATRNLAHRSEPSTYHEPAPRHDVDVLASQFSSDHLQSSHPAEVRPSQEEFRE